jgi:predicted RNA-binding protein with PIN domain
MNYIIDGYNLLHAMGAMRSRHGPGGLEKARLRLLGILQGAFGDDVAALTVVFDASQAPPDVPAQSHCRGVRLHFARDQEADDVIETLIAEHGTPKSLTVVSDDHRLQRAARRRRAHGLGCEAFMKLLLERRRTRPALPEKPTLSEAQSQELIEEFSHLDAELRRELDPFGFGAIDDGP